MTFLQSVPQPKALEELSRVENAPGIQGRLDGAHESEFDRCGDAGKLRSLQLPDAVLGRDRSAAGEHDVVHRTRDLIPAREKRGLVGAGRLSDVVVHVAIPEMPDR